MIAQHGQGRRRTRDRRRRFAALADGFMGRGAVMSEEAEVQDGVGRRTILRLGAVGMAGVALGAGRAMGAPYLARKGLLSADGAFAATSIALTERSTSNRSRRVR
jgi:hypothetical protein